MARRRYELPEPELNQALEDLVERAQEAYGASDGAELVRQMLVTGVRLLSDGADPGDLKLLNSALKELRHSLRVFGPYAHMRKVAVFGSARTRPDSADWEQARIFAELAETQHFFTNHQIVIDGDTARAQMHMRAEHWLADPGIEGTDRYTMFGYYDDRMTKTRKGWKIAEMQLNVTRTEGDRWVMEEAQRRSRAGR